MKNHYITYTAAFLVVASSGFMIGRLSMGSDISSPTEKITGISISKRTAQLAGDSLSKKGKAARPGILSAKGEITPQNRLARLDTILQTENPLDRNRAMLAYVDRLSAGDFEEVVSHLRSLGVQQEERRSEYALLLGAWAQLDPTAALEYAKDNTRNGFATDTILTTWASNDPEASIRWALSNHTDGSANPYLPGIIRALAGTDASKAFELLSSMPKSAERAEGLDAMLPHILRQGAGATRDWISQIQDETLRNGALLRATEGLAALDPAGTASFLMANPGEAADRRLDNVYSAWSKQNPQEAYASYQSLPQGNARSRALSGLIGNVTMQDPQAGLTLMKNNPSDVNDSVLQRFVWHSLGSDPEVATSQIASISDQDTRDKMYRRALDSWIEDDPAKAQAWIDKNTLPDSVKSHLDKKRIVKQ